MARKKTVKKSRKQKVSKKTIKYFKEACSPKKKKLKYTCYTKSALIKLKKAWNLRNPDSQIHDMQPKKIWGALQKYMNNTCEKESCWIRHQCIKNNINISKMEKMFAPKSPKIWKDNPREWLSTLDIHNVMKQWEECDKTFRFLGASPLDYDKKLIYGECVWDDLCRFSLKREIDNKIRKIGVVFNLDIHTKPGSHWVACYIDINKKKIYFFDSYGDPPPNRIMKFCKDVKKQGSKLGKKYDIIINTTRYQHSNGECGMFSMYFIIQLLKGVDYNKLNADMLSDTNMSKFRKKFFNIPK